MKVVDKINEILKAKGMSKKELADKLITLEMKSNKTGEIPSISGIYSYLNGNIEIKADMIPYIAEALGVWEQEIYSDKSKSEKIIHKLYSMDINYNKYIEIIDLLEYAPPKTIESLIKMLNNYKTKVQDLNKTIENMS